MIAWETESAQGFYRFGTVLCISLEKAKDVNHIYIDGQHHDVNGNEVYINGLPCKLHEVVISKVELSPETMQKHFEKAKTL